MEVLLATSMKDEGPYILEWLAYHKSVGFNKFIIFENDSSDFTDEILNQLCELGEITYIKNSEPSNSPQMTSLKRCRTMEEYQQSDWFLFIDCDEFFVPKKCDSVKDFLLNYQNYHAIAINWLNFGSSGQTHWHNAMTIDRFKRCSDYGSTMNKYFKCFHRPSGPFSRIGIHRPWPIEPISGFVYADRTTVSADIQNGAHPTNANDPTRSHSICSLNHYSLRSHEEYKRKELRGRGFVYNSKYGGEKKFKKFDDNSNENRDIEKFSSIARDLLHEYLLNARLRELHTKTCSLHFPR